MRRLREPSKVWGNERARRASKSLTAARTVSPCQARTLEYAYTALGQSPEDVRMRATLAVPIRNVSGDWTHLRVWCYDRSYDDRNFTVLERGWAGAPQAFEQRAVAIIDDLRELDLPVSKDRRFRSVISFPVSGRPDGDDPYGVISLDAQPVAFFGVEDTERLKTYLQPAIQTIGLVLNHRQKNASFTFE